MPTAISPKVPDSLSNAIFGTITVNLLNARNGVYLSRKSAGNGWGGILRGYHAVIEGNNPVHSPGELAVVRGDDEGLP